jgi:hypothetical protein
MTGGNVTEVLIGYYRYTDIWFDWYVLRRSNSAFDGKFETMKRHRAIPDEEDGTILKAILG